MYFLLFLIIVCAWNLTGRYKESDLIKLDIRINGDQVEPLATIVHKDKVICVIFSSGDIVSVFDP